MSLRVRGPSLRLLASYKEWSNGKFSGVKRTGRNVCPMTAGKTVMKPALADSKGKRENRDGWRRGAGRYNGATTFGVWPR
jgi:hypothetical protein